MSSPKHLIFNIAKIVIPVAIIGYLLYRIEPEQWSALTEHPKNYPLLIAAILVAIGAISLSFARWCMLVRCQGIELSMLEAQRLGAICFLLNFVSAGSVGGDLFKAIFLAKRRPTKKVAAVASVLVDRGVGLFGLVLLASFAFLFHSGDPNSADPNVETTMTTLKTGAAILVGTGSFVLAVLVFGGNFVDRLVQWGSGLPVVGGLIGHVGPPLRMFHNHPIAFGCSILMSICVHGLLTVSMYLIALSLYPSIPTLAEHYIIVPIGMFASAMPLTPAGIGVFEAAVELMYKVIPAVPTTASGTLVALVFEMVKLIIAVIGTVFYWTAPTEVLESLEEAEHTSEEDLTSEPPSSEADVRAKLKDDADAPAMSE